MGMARQDSPPFYSDKIRLLRYLDAEGKEHPIAAASEWPRRRAHILAGMQQVMGPLPPDERKVPLDVHVYDELRLQRYVRKTISFAAEAGDRVPAFLLIPHDLKGKTAAVLCLHQTTPIGKQEPAGMGVRNLAYAAELAERGRVTLAPDYPGFGDYTIDVYAKGYLSATMKGIWNHRRAVDLLESLPEVDAARIGVIGHSLGGHNSLFVAAFDPRIKAAVTSCGFTAFPKYFGGNLKGWSHKGYMPRIESEYGKDPRRVPFDFTEILGAIAPRALFINAPLKDANFDVSGVRDCVASASPVYELLGAKDALRAVYPDAAHDFPPEIRQQAYEFLEDALK
jgi:pimeloyl-ACP methyl ester carboxylesterase